MLEVVLYQPQIAPNTGNAIRLSANTGARLHLVEPLGFSMDDRNLRRAGLDYHHLALVRRHPSWESCRAALAGRRLFTFTSRGERLYTEPAYRLDDVLVFGQESAGLPESLLAQFPPEARLRVPMREGNRSLNLSNTIAVAVYEAWRQNGFAGSG